MYAMLTGELPFVVDPPNNMSKLHAKILKGFKMPDNLSKGGLSFSICITRFLKVLGLSKEIRILHARANPCFVSIFAKKEGRVALNALKRTPV